MKQNDFTMPYQKLDLHPTKLSLCFDELEIGNDVADKSVYSLKKIFNVLEDRRWSIFTEILAENNIKTGQDFEHFQAVVQEHCINKGISDYLSIKKVWEEHRKSIKEAIKQIKGDTDGSI